jgi:CRP-like cAMP-binding protein
VVKVRVTPDQDQHRRNRLLAALRPRDFALLEPHLQIVPVAEGDFLHLPGDEIQQVYFLHKGIVSLMAVSKDGNAISTASVGSEGAIGTNAGTGFVHAFTRALVQAPGVASKIAVSPFRRAVSKSSRRAYATRSSSAHSTSFWSTSRSGDDAAKSITL